MGLNWFWYQHFNLSRPDNVRVACMPVMQICAKVLQFENIFHSQLVISTLFLFHISFFTVHNAIQCLRNFRNLLMAQYISILDNKCIREVQFRISFIPVGCLFAIFSPRPLLYAPLFPAPSLWLVDLWETWDSFSHLLFLYWLKALGGEIQVLFIQYGQIA